MPEQGHRKDANQVRNTRQRQPRQPQVSQGELLVREILPGIRHRATDKHQHDDQNGELQQREDPFGVHQRSKRKEWSWTSSSGLAVSTRIVLGCRLVWSHSQGQQLVAKHLNRQTRASVVRFSAGFGFTLYFDGCQRILCRPVATVARAMLSFPVTVDSLRSRPTRILTIA